MVSELYKTYEQYVEMYSMKSNIANIVCGIPQGSIPIVVIVPKLMY